MSSEKEKRKFSIRNIHLTSTISMSLVLFLIGMVSMLLFAAREMSTQIKENINLSLILDDDISSSGIKRIEQYLTKSDYAKSVQFISKEDALQEHIKSMGEDPAEFLGFNPLKASLEVKLNADYANTDSVSVIESKLKVFDGISRIAYQKDMIDLVNENVSRISIILISIAVILLLISIALINNTIKVSIYANRFLINTMKLVGATPWFIRKPYILRGMLSGFLASLIALVILSGMVMYISNETSIDFFTLKVSTLTNIAGIVILLGIIITAFSSYLAVGRYLRMQTNDMYFA